MLFFLNHLIEKSGNIDMTILMEQIGGGDMTVIMMFKLCTTRTLLFLLLSSLSILFAYVNLWCA